MLGAAAPLTPLLRVTSLSFLILIWYNKQVAQFRKCGKPATCVSQYVETRLTGTHGNGVRKM